MNQDTANDPGAVTARWIIDNQDRDWNDKEKERVQSYLESKRKIRRKGVGKTWKIQYRKIKKIARRKGVQI